ncbi:MAG: UDP-N-acetylmuramate dehydrogenase [Deltaproteobacteria bacterium]|nr:UDP-N-acetylmuramate dehydrogenase [Deltaproteobacteria bacterium]MBW2417046.1 UDP-N-acetylmuramate dehydrogenase [Deltaproteobacteria bacterium]
MIKREARSALEEVLGDHVRFGVSMAKHTSLRVGGRADAIASPASPAELAGALRVCHSHGLRHTVLGKGFNTLVRDEGIDGLVLLLGGLRELEERPGLLLRAGAGVSHSQITRFCVERGFAGLEFAAGIPGTVGGWVAMNAGIGSREAKDVVREIEVVSPTGRRRRHLRRASLHFRYRALRGLAPGSVVVSALFAVGLADREAVRAEVALKLAARARTQPLNIPSCGSVFKNPTGDFAGRLIEAAGLKGLQVGGAQISPVHANFIANTGGASAADVLALIEQARDRVERESGVRLETEVKILGRAA